MTLSWGPARLSLGRSCASSRLPFSRRDWRHTCGAGRVVTPIREVGTSPTSPSVVLVGLARVGWLMWVWSPRAVLMVLIWLLHPVLSVLLVLRVEVVNGILGGEGGRGIGDGSLSLFAQYLLYFVDFYLYAYWIYEFFKWSVMKKNNKF